MKKKSFLTMIMAFAMTSLCCLLTACSDDDNDDTDRPCRLSLTTVLTIHFERNGRRVSVVRSASLVFYS